MDLPPMFHQKNMAFKNQIKIRKCKQPSQNYYTLTSTIEISEVATLTHKPGDHSMKNTALVAESRFTRTQLFEILRSFWHSRPKQTELDSTDGFVPDGNIEENGIRYLGVCFSE